MITEADLEEIWPRYERWEKEGRPAYSQYAVNAKGQFYYDHYLHNVRPVEGKIDTYTFEIQVYDSPEGDTWIVGEFVCEDGKIRIIGQCKDER